VVATDGHQFWVALIEKWVDATDLRRGHWLQTSAGTWVQVTEVDRFSQRARVHNLTVNDLHTYHVLAGSAPVLVHNTNGCTPLSQSALDEAFNLANTPQKLEHVLDPAKHGFGDLVTAAEGRSEAMRAITDSLRCTCGLPKAGPLEV
jgi:hypothetical protein